MSKPLPKPNVVMPMNGQVKLTPEMVKAIACNPIYAGIGPYRRLHSDEEWVKCAAKIIMEDGAEQFLVNLLAVLRPCFAHAHTEEP
jgi:hypothetical protein